MDNLTGKAVAITGASSGIGAGRPPCGSRRGRSLPPYRGTDVRQRADMEALVALAREQFGQLDVLVSNAGLGLLSRFDELRVEDGSRCRT